MGQARVHPGLYACIEDMRSGRVDFVNALAPETREKLFTVIDGNPEQQTKLNTLIAHLKGEILASSEALKRLSKLQHDLQYKLVESTAASAWAGLIRFNMPATKCCPH